MSFHVNRTLLPGSTCTAAPPPGWAIGGVAVLVALPGYHAGGIRELVKMNHRPAKPEMGLLCAGASAERVRVLYGGGVRAEGGGGGDQKFEIIDGDGRPTRRQHDDGTELMP
eukprot:1933994-Rhodomonas_salina.2